MKHIASAVSVAALLGLSAAGYAQQAAPQGGQQPMERGAGDQRSQQAGVAGEQKEQRGERKILGRVVDSKDVEIKGIDDRHKLVRIEHNDNRIVVDLGVQQEEQQLDLEEGDILFVSGRSGRINDKPVLIAQWAAELVPVGQDVKTEN